jgi:hypothetical protein
MQGMMMMMMMMTMMMMMQWHAADLVQCSARGSRPGHVCLPHCIPVCCPVGRLDIAGSVQQPHCPMPALSAADKLQRGKDSGTSCHNEQVLHK